MDLNRMPIFSLIAQRMGWLSERQKVLADNVANADTPRFRSHDLVPLSFKDMLARVPGRVAAATTDAQHLSQGSTGTRARASNSKSHGKVLSGNTVSINDEMMKVSETANEYSLVTSLYRKQVGMLRAVLNRSS